MADLKKMFVYVPNDKINDFKNEYNAAGGATKYNNRIVFFEPVEGGSGSLFLNGKNYGLSEAGQIGDITGNISKITQALWGSDVASDSIDLGALTVTVYGKDSENTVVTDAIKDNVTNILKTSFPTLIGNAVKKGAENLKKEFPIVQVEGSGLTLDADSTDANGAKIYKIKADASLWEFMGNVGTEQAPIAITEVSSKLDEQYAEGGSAKRRTKEAGDVWQVYVNTTPVAALLYAWNGKSWVSIGSPSGISFVNTNPVYGLKLVNEDGTLKLDGTGVLTTINAAGENPSLVTGDAVKAYVTSVIGGIKPVTVAAAADTDYASVTVTQDPAASGNYKVAASVKIDAVTQYVFDNSWEQYGAVAPGV